MDILAIIATVPAEQNKNLFSIFFFFDFLNHFPEIKTGSWMIFRVNDAHCSSNVCVSVSVCHRLSFLLILRRLAFDLLSTSRLDRSSLLGTLFNEYNPFSCAFYTLGEIHRNFTVKSIEVVTTTIVLQKALKYIVTVFLQPNHFISRSD